MPNRNAYVFLCSNSTEDECLKKMLLGGKESYQKQIPAVDPGDTLFLYNYQSQRLHGIFSATSQAEMNIDPYAWGGEFPWQVKMEWKKKYPPLDKLDISKVITFTGRGFPRSKVTIEQVNKLEIEFEKMSNIPEEESKFRQHNQLKYQAEDGHWVRSMGEVTIDNWLYRQRILHAYEPKVKNIPEEMYCDFAIPLFEQREHIYIELWGLNDKEYEKRKQQKISLYQKYNLRLVEITQRELETLDDTLTRKLRQHLPDHTFF